jgi:DNA repair protein RecN (Recombination protein N)
MLCELRVKNLALIESLVLRFAPQSGTDLVVMTGETGAGKSIMLRAVQLLSGKRASTDWIRGGAESCEVAALFEVSLQHYQLQALLETSGLEKTTTVIIKRVLNNSGRSRYYVNDSLVTAKLAAEIADELLTMAGQHDQQRLIQPSSHLDFLDTMGDLWPQRQEVGRLYRTYCAKIDELAELRRQEQEKEQRRGFLQYQLEEIRAAALQEDEEEQLLAEKKRLKNGQALTSLSQDSYALLSGELADGLAKLRQNVSQLAAIDPSATKLAEDISGFTFLAEDYRNELRHYRDQLEAEPYRLEQVTERLDLLQQLKRKYGATIRDVLEYAEKGATELIRLENMELQLGALQREVKLLEQELTKNAEDLSARRVKVGHELEEAMTRELQSLAFNQARLTVQWQEGAHIPRTLRASGWDKGEFLFAPNVGEPQRPLAKIASGGELSRLMLAMKCLLAKKDMVETVIFDEVDTGIGGEAAEAVARKIQELAGHHQVLCITHLPQIAARGTMHLLVEKQVDGGRTQTIVRQLDQPKRVAELVRMLAGESPTEETQAWARQLLVKGRVAA